jgi:hypothetical protein
MDLKKRALLPVWIKIFIWVFLLMACAIPLVAVMNIMGYPAALSLYGLESNNVFSVPGLIITILILYKGIVAIGLWTGKDWAVKNAIIDAILGIVICIIIMLLPLFLSSHFFISFRLELIALVLYYLKMKDIQKKWNNEEEAIDPVSEKAEPEAQIEKVVSYKKHTYKCEDGILTIEQEFQNPNIGEKVFLNEKPAPFGKYKIGFMSHIFVDNGVIESFSSR